MKQVLLNHTTQETAYLVSDYPYGNKRCQIKFWLEQDPKKGFRFCSQTEHPVKKVWNAPKKSTYHLISACMYLNEENGHIEWSCFNDWDAEKALEYVQSFSNAPGIDVVKRFAGMKIVKLEYRVEKRSTGFLINGVAEEYTKGHFERDTKELEGWRKVLELLR